MLLDRFVELCREKGPDLAKRLAPDTQSDAEDQWAAAARERWYSLPAKAQRPLAALRRRRLRPRGGPE